MLLKINGKKKNKRIEEKPEFKILDEKNSEWSRNILSKGFVGKKVQEYRNSLQLGLRMP